MLLERGELIVDLLQCEEADGVGLLPVTLYFGRRILLVRHAHAVLVHGPAEKAGEYGAIVVAGLGRKALIMELRGRRMAKSNSPLSEKFV